VSLNRRAQLKRSVSRWFSGLGLIALVAILLAPRIVHRDERWLLTVNGEPIDVIGAVVEGWGRLSSDCSAVTTVALDTVEGRLLRDLLRRHSPPDSESARLVRVDSARGWLLVEAGFDVLPPVLVLIRSESQQPAAMEIRAVWSGSAHPWRLVPFAAEYLSVRAPDAPPELIRCARPSFR